MLFHRRCAVAVVDFMLPILVQLNCGCRFHAPCSCAVAFVDFMLPVLAQLRL